MFFRVFCVAKAHVLVCHDRLAPIVHRCRRCRGTGVKGMVRLGLIAGLVFLARLDAMFLVAVYGCWVLCGGCGGSGPAIWFARRALVLLLPCPTWFSTGFIFLSCPYLSAVGSSRVFPRSFCDPSMPVRVACCGPFRLQHLVWHFADRGGAVCADLARWIAQCFHLPWVLWVERFALGLHWPLHPLRYLLVLVLRASGGAPRADDGDRLAGTGITLSRSERNDPGRAPPAATLATVGLLVVFAAVVALSRWRDQRMRWNKYLDFISAHDLHRMGHPDQRLSGQSGVSLAGQLHCCRGHADGES